MKNMIETPSVLLSIFKRKGGEGIMTKIITDDNKTCYFEELKLLQNDETPLLCFRENEFNWLLLTNKQVLMNEAGLKKGIDFSKLRSVDLDIQEEFRNKVIDKNKFTRLILIDNDGVIYSLRIEEGEPFWGLFQVLDYIVSKRINSDR